MPPSLALCVFFILLVALLAFDPAKDSRVSLALWVPWTWMVIVGSRLPSQWLGADTGAAAAQGLQDGDPLDRTVFLLLIVLAAAVLRSRSFRWGHFFAHNIALTALLSFCLLSVIWSDFPFVAFKRWFRDLGNYIVILVVLSDPHPLEALRTLLRRLCYLLIPLSIVLIKYFPQLGRSYDEFTGGVTYSGVQTSKYLLGTLCMISGIFFLGHGDAVVQEGGTPDQADRRRQRRVFRHDALAAVYGECRDLPGVPVARMHGCGSGSQQGGQAPSSPADVFNSVERLFVFISSFRHRHESFDRWGGRARSDLHRPDPLVVIPYQNENEPGHRYGL